MADVNSKPEEMAARSERAAKEAVERGADTMLNATQIMADVARRAMDQGQEAMRACFSTLTGAQAPVAESTYLQGRRAVEYGVGILSAYQEALDRSAEDLQALTTAGIALGRGMQRWQHAAFEGLQKSFEAWGKRPQELINCSSPTEAARLQRDIYLDLMRGMLDYNTTVLQLAAEVTQEALRPLQSRVRR